MKAAHGPIGLKLMTRKRLISKQDSAPEFPQPQDDRPITPVTGVARDNPLLLIRSRKVNKFLRQLRRVIRKLFRTHVKESQNRVIDGLEVIPIDFADRWTDQLIQVQKRKLFFVGSEGAKQARQEMGLEKAADPLVGPESLIIIAEESEDFLLKPVEERVEEWLNQVSSKSTKTNANKIQKVHDEIVGAVNPDTGFPFTPKQVAKKIGAVTGFTDSRAEMIANTNTNFAFNAGIVEQYKQLGVPAFEWMTTEDERVCPFCERMDGVIIASGDSFWSEGDKFGVVTGQNEDGSDVVRTLNISFQVLHPPLHPR